MSDRICAPDIDHNRSYCGRKGQKTDVWSRVTCTDCHAAWRADHPTKGQKR